MNRLLRFITIAAPLTTSIALARLSAQGDASRGQLASWALDAFDPLRAGISLGDWRRRHPEDFVELATRAAGFDSDHETWCAVAHVLSAIPGGPDIARDAYFYVPPRARGEDLPQAGQASPETCQVGKVLVTAYTGDSLNAISAQRGDSERIATVVGVAARHRGTTSRPQYWDFDLSAASGPLFVVGRIENPGRPAPGVVRQFVRSIAVIGPFTDDDMDRARWFSGQPDGSAPRPHRAPEIDTLIGLAGLDAASAAAVRGFADDFAGVGRRDVHYDIADQLRFEATLSALVSSLAPQHIEQRIGGLVLADRLLDLSGSSVEWPDTTKSTSRARLEALGARFVYEEMGAAFVMDHVWLWQALDLGGATPAAQRAFLFAMRLGFEPSGVCKTFGRDSYWEVVRRGEPFLAENPDSPFRGEVELMLGEAYSDIIASVASGELGRPGRKDAPSLDLARVRAIGYFHEGFRHVGDSPRADADWPDAWRLIAGLAPQGIHFGCRGD